MQALSANGLGEVADEVALRAHLDGGPVGESTVVHCEPVMMFEDRNDVAGARQLKEMCPGDGIEVRCFELWNKVFVTEFVLRSVSGYVVVVHVDRKSTRLNSSH